MSACYFFQQLFFHAIDPFALWIDIFIYNKSTTWREKSYISRDFHQAVLFFLQLVIDVSFNLFRDCVLVCRAVTHTGQQWTKADEHCWRKSAGRAHFANEKATLEASSPSWTKQLVSLRFHFNFQFFNFSDSRQATLWQLSKWNWEISFWHLTTTNAASRLWLRKKAWCFVYYMFLCNSTEVADLLEFAHETDSKCVKGFHISQSTVELTLNRLFIEQKTLSRHDYRVRALDVAPFYWFFMLIARSSRLCAQCEENVSISIWWTTRMKKRI